MKLLKYLLPFALATCGAVATLRADDNGFSTTVEERERDTKAVEDFINTKRSLTVAEKGGNLAISGDVRAEWEHLHSKIKGTKQRGKGSANLCPPSRPHAPYPTNEFDVEVNLRFDYKNDGTWATLQWQFSDPAGIPSQEYVKHKQSKRNTLWGSGKLDNIVLRKAFMGYNVMEQGTSRFDVEIGRRRLYDVFDSKIQFNSFFDGLLLRYVTSFEGMTDFTAKVAAFVIDHTVNHFGYVGELGFLNIADLGLDFKYSLISWEKSGVNRYNYKHSKGNDYLNSQLALAYNFSPDMFRHKTQVYGAYLHNHDAKARKFTDHKKANKAYYVGAKMGDVRKKSDWSVDASYQWVQAQAIPEQDVSGIGRDNPRKICFGKKKWGGFANYKGYTLGGVYAITDNLTFNLTFSKVHQCQRSIGGKHRSYGLDLEAIYAF